MKLFHKIPLFLNDGFPQKMHKPGRLQVKEVWAPVTLPGYNPLVQNFSKVYICETYKIKETKKTSKPAQIVKIANLVKVVMKNCVNLV